MNTNTAVLGSRARDFALDFRTYKHNEGDSLPERMAHAIDWASAQFPKQWVALNVLLKAVMGYAHLPTMRSKEIDGLRGRTGRTREILRVKYGRGLLVGRGLGMRGTVGSEDAMKTAVVAATQRYASMSASLSKIATLVDISEVKATAENKPWIAWWKGDLHDKLKLLQSTDYLKRLAPPGSTEPEKNGVPSKTHGK
jgi:hypothetical protein